jgi:hypothetical protein
MSSIYDGLKYLYAEQLKGKRVTLKIKAVTAETIKGDGGRESQGHVIAFEKTPKMLVVTGSTVKRQLAMACGTENPDEMIGKEVTLYPTKSTRSITGLAIRIAVPEQHA